ncbi:uncharacterized protein LODBEIA_P22490 [Lodderomyces beijingensis]|uniref:Regulator of rDNA transcription 14 n=1 Tax=Lodderomyces beijingensis TaxID=1775926 RepID=A0ABP0ZP79_9ASCO
MSFSSNAAKHQAEQTVNRMFAEILHTQPKKPHSKPSSSASPLSTTQLLSQQLGKKPQHRESDKVKKSKTLQKKHMKKKQEQDKKFQKFIKYSMIKSKWDTDPKSLTAEEHKYLSKLTRRNINQLRKWNEIDDFEISEEMARVKSELLLDIAPAQRKRLRKKLAVPSPRGKKGDNNVDFVDFDAKVKKGLISVPGLTPGLAPVDYDESDSE